MRAYARELQEGKNVAHEAELEHALQLSERRAMEKYSTSAT